MQRAMWLSLRPTTCRVSKFDPQPGAREMLDLRYQCEQFNWVQFPICIVDVDATVDVDE